jgi:hypothetical protein
LLYYYDLFQTYRKIKSTTVTFYFIIYVFISLTLCSVYELVFTEKNAWQLFSLGNGALPSMVCSYSQQC